MTTPSEPRKLNVGAAVRRLREAKRLTLDQIAARLDMNKSTLSKLETNKQGYSGALIEKIAQVLEVSPIDIYTAADHDNAEPAPALREYRAVPVVGTVQAGPDGYFEEFEHPVGYGDGIVEHPAKGRNTYALRVRGESMHPRIRSGEFIVAEPDSPPRPGDDVVVICRDGRKMVKQMLYERDGEVTLGSINNGFKPLTVPFSEIQAIHCVAAILPRGAFIHSGDGNS